MSNLKRIVEFNYGLGGDYNNVGEIIIQGIKREKALLYVDIASAVELCMLDFKVENAGFYDILKPFYNENYDLIPIVGFDELMNLAVENYLLETSIGFADIIGKAVAFDYLINRMDTKVTYNNKELENFINNIIPTSYDAIADMLEDVDLALQIFKKHEPKPRKKCEGCKNCTCDSKKKTSPQIKVIVLDNNKIADDILALLKLINGNK